jgi:hypothetical protein
MHNKYEFKLVDARTGEIKQECTAYNLVTNAYYNALRSNAAIYLQYVHLGSGTTAPAVTDTALTSPFYSKNFMWWDEYGGYWGGYTNSMRYEGPNQYAISKTITFTEDEANGNIAEIGLSNFSYDHWQMVLYTHALITDAEGHPISIAKTNTDRLILTITLYITLQLPNTVLPFRGSKYCASMYADQEITDTWASFDGCPPIVMWAGGLYPGNYYSAGSAFDTVSFSASPGGMTAVIVRSDGYLDNMYSSTTCSTISGGIRITMNNRLLAAECNLPVNFQLYDIITGFGHIPITSDIFPPIDLTISRNSDGTTTDFNFGVAELMDDVKVYIDDVLQPANSYTWNRFDKTLYQSWETCRGDYLIKAAGIRPTGQYGGYNSSLIFNSDCYTKPDRHYTSQYFIYDFKEIKTFNRAYRDNPSSTYTSWQYSNDGETWTTLTIPTSANKIYDFPTPFSARYLKIPIAYLDTRWDQGYQPPGVNGQPCLLCDYKPQLKFNTAPQAGSVVKIEAKSAYPIKNANWIVDQLVIDLTIDRGN